MIVGIITNFIFSATRIISKMTIDWRFDNNILSTKSKRIKANLNYRKVNVNSNLIKHESFIVLAYNNKRATWVVRIYVDNLLF